MCDLVFSILDILPAAILHTGGPSLWGYPQTLSAFLKINFYWSTVALQCYVSFCCAAKWVSYTYTYIASFLDFLPIWVTTEYWVQFPLLYSRFSLVICFIPRSPALYVNSLPLSTILYIVVYMCQSQSPNSPPLFSHFICVSISALQINSSVPFF